MQVVSFSQHPPHLFSERCVAQIVLLEGLGASTVIGMTWPAEPQQRLVCV